MKDTEARHDGSEVGVYGLGLGREGVRYAIQEMTELRVLTLKLD